MKFSTEAGGYQMKQATTDQGDTVRICNVPKEISIGEALRKADRIACERADAAHSAKPATVAWDRIKGATPGTIQF
jgi:hypothetical protein